MKRDYNDKAVLITGAGGGLGRALAQRFAAAGARIGGLDLDQTGLETTRAAIESKGGTFASQVCDICDESAVQTAIAALETQLGLIYVLINNAGITHLKNFGADQASAIRKVVEVNLMGTVHCTAAVYEQLRTQQGQMIAISSVAGYAPLVGRTGYCASKHALQGFCNTLRCELRDTGVGIMVVCPSYIATGIRHQYERSDEDHQNQTVGSEDTPEAVADMIFLAASKDRRHLSTGIVGKISDRLWRFTPRLYEWFMLRNVQDEH